MKDEETAELTTQDSGLSKNSVGRRPYALAQRETNACNAKY